MLWTGRDLFQLDLRIALQIITKISLSRNSLSRKRTYFFYNPVRYGLVIPLLLITLLPTTDTLAQLVPPPNVRPSRPSRLNVQFHRAETAWKSGSSLLEAKARIDRVLIERPKDVEARKLRAGIYMSMGAPEKALLDAREAVRLNPLDGEAQLLVCEAAIRSGEVDAALVGLNLSADLLLEQSTFHVRLSRCAIDLNEYDAAEAYARTALAGNARSAEANLQLARVFLITDEQEKAVTVLKRAIDAHILSTSVIRRDTTFSSVLGELQ